MLPNDWKKEIEDTLDKAANQNEENDQRRQNAIASSLDRFAKKFVVFIRDQRERERGKRCREIVTICGLFLTAAIALGTAGVLAAQWYEFRTGNVAVQRAFITSYEVKITPDNPSAPASWAISPLLENAGNTSATQLRVRIDRTYYDRTWRMSILAQKAKPGAFDLDTSEVEFEGMPAASITLAPHAKISLATYVVTEGAIEFLRADTLTSYLFGEAEYFDVFNAWHRTKFCYRLMGRTVSVNDDDVGIATNMGDAHRFVPDRFEITRNDLTYRLCRRNNCIDGQCANNRERPVMEHPPVTVLKTYPPPPEPQRNGAILKLEKE